jgi:hypothetical protein
MPPRGYRHLSVREDVYVRLEEFARNRGLASPADAIPVLLEYADIHSKLEHLLQASVRDLLQACATPPQTGASQAKVPNSAQQAGGTSQQGPKPRKTAWDILREQEIVCASTMKARDPDKIINILRDSGAVVIASENDRCAVYPDTWMSFVEALAKAGSPDEREVAGRLRGRAKQLFKMLRAAGAVHYDSKTKTWVVDPSVVEEAGRAPGLAGTGGEEEAGGHVLRIPVEEAGDPERYMAEMERKGWLCNEVARQVVCVWREALEQAIVDLNSSGAGARDMERVLAGDSVKLEAARAAYEAGLLWYSSQEKRWKAAL